MSCRGNASPARWAAVAALAMLGTLAAGRPAGHNTADRPTRAATATIATLRAAGMQVLPVATPRFSPGTWSVEPGGSGAHLRLRLKGVSRTTAEAWAEQPGGIVADLYLSTWKVVPRRGATMLLVDIRVMDPVAGESLWSNSFLTGFDGELDALQRALQEAISEALQQSMQRQRSLLTV